MAIGQFGSALEEVLKRKGQTKIQAAQVAKIDNSTLGKIIKGSRKAPKDIMRSTATHYDDGQLYIAAAGRSPVAPSPPGSTMWIYIEHRCFSKRSRK